VEKAGMGLCKQVLVELGSGEDEGMMRVTPGKGNIGNKPWISGENIRNSRRLSFTLSKLGYLANRPWVKDEYARPTVNQNEIMFRLPGRTPATGK
jgi:hypothetical protein